MKNFKLSLSFLFLFITIFSMIIISACRQENSNGTTDITGSTIVSEATTVSTTPEPTTTPTPSPTPGVDLSLFAIQPQYTYAGLFNEDSYAVVSTSNDPNYTDNLVIDETGAVVFGPVNWVLPDDSPNLMPFCVNGKCGYINSKFEVVIEPEYDDAGIADEDGCYTVRKDGKWGRIDEKNQWVCPPEFESIGTYYSDGLIGASKQKKFVLIDRTGKIITSTDTAYDKTYYSPEHKLFSFVEKGLTGLMDKSGRVILDPEYSYIAFPGCDYDYGLPMWNANDTGLLMICKGENYDKCGLANKKGEIVFEPVSEFGIEFADNGLAAVMIDGKMGYINAKGKIVIEPKYDWAFMFNFQGIAEVEFEDGSYGYIDETGRVIDPETVEANGVFQFTYKGISYGTKDGVTGLFDSNGKCVFDTEGSYPFLTKKSGNEVYLLSYEDKSIFLDLEGKIISEHPFIVEHYFSKDDTLIFRENGKYGVMDADGNRLIEPVYDRVYGDWNTNDHEGGMIINYSDRELVMTLAEGKYPAYSPVYFGILSSDGKELMPPISPNYITVSVNGMVPVQVGELFGYVKIDVG